MDVLYGLGVLSTGLFAGLMMTLVFLLQRQWGAQDKVSYVTGFRQFLLAAKGHPLITLLTFISFIAPSVLAVLAYQSGRVLDGTLFVLAAAIFFLGCFVVTVFLNLPIYNTVISWERESDYGAWHEVRRRFFTLNVIRFASALASFLLMIAAGLTA